MSENKLPEHLVFGLDIGTRSIVGSVGYMEHNKFNVVAHYVKEHETRAMIDGQIHDIQKVGESIGVVKRELENQLGRPLKDVCIAAAGRVLKTATVHVEIKRTDDLPVESEEIYSLDMAGVEQAYKIMRSEYPEINFYCVGYSVVKYYMNDYIIGNLEGHKAKTIGADVLATFLPNEVVDGLYASTEIAGLKVSSLTLEPIAAINIAIPESYRLLNIALVDVGAGTSDICITKDGSITAYGMIPHAGDEITEAIVQKCLCDFQTAEKIKVGSMKKGAKSVTFKDIMGLKQKLTTEQVKNIYKDTVQSMTGEIAEKIKELNGGKSVNAVFVVGGGGKAAGFTESLANCLNIPHERVALRGEEVLTDVNFLVEGVKKDPLLVTPIGICVNYYNNKNNFIFVIINGERIKLYDNDHLTVVDAAMQIGFPNENLFPKRGDALQFTVNGKSRIVRGEAGDGAHITINGREGNINSKIIKNDDICITPSTAGENARYLIENLDEFRHSITVIINGTAVTCPKFAEVNKNLVSGSYSIKNGDDVVIRDYYTVEQLIQFIDIDTTGKNIFINGHLAADDEPVYENFQIQLKDIDYLSDTDVHDSDSDYSSPDEAGTYKSIPDITTKNTGITISVMVNNTPVTLSGKSSYIFVDILDFYPFDTKNPQGTELVITINDLPALFTTPINQGDLLSIYWK